MHSWGDTTMVAVTFIITITITFTFVLLRIFSKLNIILVVEDGKRSRRRKWRQNEPTLSGSISWYRCWKHTKAALIVPKSEQLIK